MHCLLPPLAENSAIIWHAQMFGRRGDATTGIIPGLSKVRTLNHFRLFFAEMVQTDTSPFPESSLPVPAFSCEGIVPQ